MTDHLISIVLVLKRFEQNGIKVELLGEIDCFAPEEVKMASVVDDINAYSYLYPLELPDKKFVFKWVESRKPQHYSSAAPLSRYLYSLSASTLNKQWDTMGRFLKETVESFRLIPPTENYVPPYKDPWRFW